MSGSSPHTRGAPTAPWLRCLPPWDHPRIRGEHGRVRGLDGLDLRIIPAYAGSTEFGDAAEGDVMGSSPHTRGALEEQLRKVAEEAGSSPHTRGAHLTTCANIPHFPVLDSVVKVHSRISRQRAASAALLSPKPPRRPILACVAPSLLRHSKHRSVISPRRSLHQFDPFTVNWLPVGLKRLER